MMQYREKPLIAKIGTIPNQEIVPFRHYKMKLGQIIIFRHNSPFPSWKWHKGIVEREEPLMIRIIQSELNIAERGAI